MATLSPSERGLTVRIAAGPFNDRFQRVLGSTLSPQNITPILVAADQGYLWALADLLEEVRERDTHLDSVLGKREKQVAGAEWELRPPQGAETDARAQEIADWCTRRLGDMEPTTELGRSFADGLEDLLGAHYQGRSGLEVIWQRQGRWRTPRTWEFIHSRRFALTTSWRLHLWDASGTAPSMLEPVDVESPFGKFPGLPLDAFPPGKFVVHAPRVRGTYPTREGLGRGLVWWAMFKRFGVRDWLAFAEWAGRGLRIGTYAAGKPGEADAPRALAEDVAVLEQALDSLSSSLAVSVPDTTKIEVKDAPDNRDVHQQLVLLCNGEMSKAVLGETLTTEVGSTGGNRALGDVHQEVRLMVAKSDARKLASTVRRSLLRPLVAMNFGDSAPVPELHFAVDPAKDLDALAKRVGTLVRDAGLEVGQRWMRNELGIDDPEPDEPLLRSPNATPASATSTPPAST